MIYVWHGREANPIVKASAISKASELNSLFVAGKDHVLKVLFSGGVIRDRKLQRGSVYTFAEAVPSDEKRGPTKELQTALESVALLKWLIRPEGDLQQAPSLKVLSMFEDSSQGYWSRFESVDAVYQSKPVESAQVVRKPTIPSLGRLDSLGGGFAKQCQDDREKALAG